MIRAIQGNSVTPSADESKYHALGEFHERGNPARTMSRSQLALFDECPMAWINGAKTEGTKAMEWGDLMDARVTNPALLSRYVVAPSTYEAPESKKKDAAMIPKAWNMNADACKDWWKLQEREGKIPVKSDVWKESEIAQSALTRDKIASEFLESCKFQVQVLCEWLDETTGIAVPIKCLIDLLPNSQWPPAIRDAFTGVAVGRWANFIGDFKTAFDLKPDAWRKAVNSHGYHTQGALYLDAWNAATGENRNAFVHIIQSSKPPYQTARRQLDDDFLELGRDTYQRQLRRYCQCLSTGVWPDYDSDRQEQGEIVDGFRIVGPSAWMITQ